MVGSVAGRRPGCRGEDLASGSRGEVAGSRQANRRGDRRLRGGVGFNSPLAHTITKPLVSDPGLGAVSGPAAVTTKTLCLEDVRLSPLLRRDPPRVGAVARLSHLSCGGTRGRSIRGNFSGENVQRDDVRLLGGRSSPSPGAGQRRRSSEGAGTSGRAGGGVVSDSCSPSRLPPQQAARVAARHVEALTRVRDEVLSNIRDAIARREAKPVHAGLFGSSARGEATSHSDIDVLLDRLDCDVRAWTGNAAQLVDLSADTLGRMDRESDPLIASWRAEVIDLHGEPLAQLLRRLL
jgi:predicted nucleotidyltransferase